MQRQGVDCGVFVGDRDPHVPPLRRQRWIALLVMGVGCDVSTVIRNVIGPVALRPPNHSNFSNPTASNNTNNTNNTNKTDKTNKASKQVVRDAPFRTDNGQHDEAKHDHDGDIRCVGDGAERANITTIEIHSVIFEQHNNGTSTTISDVGGLQQVNVDNHFGQSGARQNRRQSTVTGYENLTTTRIMTTNRVSLLHWPTRSYWSTIITGKQLQQNRTGQERSTCLSHHVSFSFVASLVGHHGKHTKKDSIAIIVGLLFSFCQSTKTHC